MEVVPVEIDDGKPLRVRFGRLLLRVGLGVGRSLLLEQRERRRVRLVLVKVDLNLAVVCPAVTLAPAAELDELAVLLVAILGGGTGLVLGRLLVRRRQQALATSIVDEGRLVIVTGGRCL